MVDGGFDNISIKTEIELIENSISEAYNEYIKIKKSGEDRIKVLRKSCKHQEISFNPDLSGNNDAFFSCDICGQEGHRKNKKL